MARQFSTSSQTYLQYGSALITTFPFTMACWFTLTTNSSGNAADLMYVGSTTTDNIYLLTARPGFGQVIQTRTYIPGNNSQAASTASFSFDRWYHACGVWESSTSKWAYLNGGNGGQDTTDHTCSNLDRTGFGRYVYGSGHGNYHDGSIAEGAIWNVALSAGEVAALGAGASPLAVRPQSLVAYWPLYGNVSPETDIISGYDMTLYNSPTEADSHPPLSFPINMWVSPFTAAPEAEAGLAGLPAWVLRGVLRGAYRGVT